MTTQTITRQDIGQNLNGSNVETYVGDGFTLTDTTGNGVYVSLPFFLNATRDTGLIEVTTTGGYDEYRFNAVVQSNSYMVLTELAWNLSSIDSDAVHSFITGIQDDTLIGGEGDDYFSASGGNDTITGGAGNDFLSGDSGNDTLRGQQGDDTVLGGSGSDSLYGGGGNDSIRGGGDDDYINGGSDNDTIYGDGGNDTIFAGSGANEVHGGAGDDSIDGGAGDEILYGGDGTDTVYGGLGDDVLSAGSRVSGGNDELTGGEGDDIFVIQDFEELAPMTVTVNSDDLESEDNGFTDSTFWDVGTELASFIPGVGEFAGLASIGVGWLADLNTAESAGGSATYDVDYETTDPIFVTDFALTDDMVLIGLNENVSGDATWDTENTFSGSGDAVVVHDGAGNLLTTIELDDISNWGDDNISTSDVRYHSAIANYLDTTLLIVTVANGAATVWQNEQGSTNAVEIVRYGDDDEEDDVAALFATMADGTYAMIGAYQKITSWGSSSASDMVFGTGFGDVLYGYGTGIAADGYSGDDDELYGFGGNDILNGGGGQNNLFGGDGMDLASYTTADAGVEIDLSDPSTDPDDVNQRERIVVHHTNNEGDGTPYTDFDLLFDMEGAIGSDYADTLIGDDSANHFAGSDGNDSITGNGGADSLYGGEGDDTVTWNWGDGDDSIFGDAGTDTLIANLDNGVSGTHSEGGWEETYILVGADTPELVRQVRDIDEDEIALVTEGDEIVRFRDIEELTIVADEDGSDISVTGSLSDAGVSQNTLHFFGGAGSDRFDGSGMNDDVRVVLSGGSGTDTLIGGAGNDLLMGGSGSDVTHGNEGIDTFIADAGENIHGLAVADLEHGETVTIQDYSFDDYSLTGSENDRALIKLDRDRDGIHETEIGLEGHFSAREIHHIVAEQSGNDLHFTLSRIVAETQILGSGGTSGDDMLAGSDEDDELFALAGDDVIDGNGGNDWATGGTGADTIRGEAGADTLDGQWGDDFVDGGTGDDVVLGHRGNDTLEGEAGDDTLKGGSQDDLIEGGFGHDLAHGQHGDDTLYGDAGDDKLIGGVGDDSLSGGDGADTLFGSDGSDTLTGGAGLDRLIGGAGADLFVLELQEDGFTDRDVIYDFGTGSDQIGLAGGLAFDDLSVTGDEIFADGVKLATFKGFDAGTLDTFDFVLV